MSARKRRKSRSPSRSWTLGLFVVLVAAVAAGVAVGRYIGRQSTTPYVPMQSAGVPQAAERHVPAPSPEPKRRTPEREEREPARTESKKATGEDKAKQAEQRAEGSSAAVPEPAKPRTRRPSGYTGELVRASGSDRIALTFDAGASPAPTPAILSALRAAGVHVTFFLTGKWAEQNPSLVKRIVAEGHEIGNHTYSHPDLRKLTDDQITDQLAKTEDIITRIAGEGSKPYFRPPFGGRDKRVLQVAAQAGYTSVYWSLDSWDSYKKGITGKEIAERVLGRIEGGDIVLMHCGSAATAQALPGIIDELQNRGYRIVSVSQLAGG